MSARERAEVTDVKLILGVNDMPYSWNPEVEHFKKRKNLKKPLQSLSKKRQLSTTGEVAEVLEKKYGVMAFFWDRHHVDIVGELSDAIEGNFNSIMNGSPRSADISAAAESEIEALFATFLSQKEMDGQVAGVATAASLHGVSHRFKHPYKRRAPRPSFIDTGLYESSFRCRVEG